MNPSDPKNRLTPLPGAKFPAPPPMPGEQEKKLAEEIAHLAKEESNTLVVLTHGIRAVAESNEEVVVLLQDIRDLLVKGLQTAGMELPARLQTAIEKGDYNPDEPDEDDEEDEVEDGDGDVLANPT